MYYCNEATRAVYKLQNISEKVRELFILKAPSHYDEYGGTKPHEAGKFPTPANFEKWLTNFAACCEHERFLANDLRRDANCSHRFGGVWSNQYKRSVAKPCEALRIHAACCARDRRLANVCEPVRTCSHDVTCEDVRSGPEYKSSVRTVIRHFKRILSSGRVRATSRPPLGH